MVAGLPHRLCRQRVQTTEGAVIKSHGAEHAGKDVVQTTSGKCKEAEHH